MLFLAALAQAPAGHTSADAPSVASGPTVVLERPPEGPRRGLVSVPAPVVYGLAAVALAVSLGYLLRRIRP
jgi:hypothetical protein